MITRLIFALLLFALPAGAVDMITATVTLTNTPNGSTNTITVNGSTRTWTNSITASPSTLIKETNSVPMSATNLLNHLSLYPPVAGQILSQTTASNVFLKALPGRALTVTIAGLWASVVYSTNTVTDATIVRVPITVEAATNQTNIASWLISALNLSTNALATNSTAASNFITKGAAAGPQYITSELRLSGNLNNGTGNLSVSNLVNSGNAIRSDGAGGNSLQIGSNAVAAGSISLAIGNSSLATNTTTLAVGTSAKATNDYAMAVGNNATAGGTDSFAVGRGALALGTGAQAIGQAALAQGLGAIAIEAETVGDLSISIGPGSSVSATNSTAFGSAATVNYNNSTAIGYSATATSTNQVRLGTSSETVSIPGVLDVSGTITNINSTGTNRLSGQLVFVPTSNTGLANGYNAGVAVDSAFIKFSGPTAAYTNVGFSAANKFDGRMHFCQFDNPGLSFTILHDSGIDPGNSTNRVYTGTGALVNSTNRVVHLIMSYDNTATAWRIWSFR